ncbi:MAG: hypothetical protein MJZ34_13795 [Paludibacteraceae bacterium]|nr:hypothetical protein [Paludibacteraceae bacterium]
MISSEYYTELTGDEETIEELLKCFQMKEYLKFSIMNQDKNSIGFSTTGLPKKSVWTKLSKLTKKHFTVTCTNAYLYEPSLILEYDLGVCIDEQVNKNYRPQSW